MPFLFWLDVSVYGLSAMLAVSITWTVLSVAPQRSLNRLFALFTLMASAWTGLACVLRLALWLGRGNVPLLSELSGFAFGLMGPLLLMFAARYVGRSTRWVDIWAGTGLLAMAAIVIPLFRHQIIVGHTLDANGTTHVSFSPAGLLTLLIPALGLIGALVIFWQTNGGGRDRYMTFSVAVLLAGLILGAVLDVSFPVMSFTTALSLTILSHRVINQQIFNPLRERTAELQREMAERERAEKWLSIQRDLSTALSVTSDLRAALDQILNILLPMPEIDSGGIYLVQDADSPMPGELVLAVHQGLSAPFVDKVRSYPAESPQARLVTNGKPLYGLTDELFKSDDLIHQQEGLRTLAVVPVWYEDADGQKKVVASLNLASHTLDEMPSDVQSVLEAIATQIGGAMRRIKAEELLRRERDMVSRITETSPVGITMVNRNGQVVFANGQAEQVLGLTRDRVLERTYNAPEWRITEQDGNPFPDEQLPFRRVMDRAETVYNVRHAIEWPDGRRIVLSINAAPLRDAAGRVDGMVATIENITERARAEEALRESEERFRTLVHSMNDIVYMLDREQRHVGIFGRWLEKEGLSADFFLGKTARKLFGPERAVLHEAANARALAGENVVYNWSMPHPDGERYYQTSVSPLRNAQGAVVGIVGVGREITDLKRAETALLNSSRMETAATLAGGVAHKVNNLMVGVLGYAELLREALNEYARPGLTPQERQIQSQDIQEMLNTIFDSARQTGDLAQQMVAFARGGRYQAQELCLNDVLRRVFHIHQSSLPERIEVEFDLAANLWDVEADPTQMSQVILNLVTNAVESIAEQGQIEIKTVNVQIDETMSLRHSDLRPGQYVCISVRDNGSGIAPHILPHIFEPFVTTKFQGRGMGLAVVYGIVTHHGGGVIAENVSGGGAVFYVYLPAVQIQTPPPAILPIDVALPQASDSPRTILVIEDDPVVMHVLRRALERMGHQLLLAHNGQEALDVARSFPDPVHLAILDLGMAVMGGAETFPLLLQLRPHIKVILCSGYDLDETAQSLLDAGAVDFVHKPFHLNVLEAAIQKALSI